MSIAAKLSPDPIRRIVHRARGSSHGFVTRLMSPGDLGRIFKPVVFLDLVDNKGKAFPTFGLHPHSGLATLTYIAEGSVSYEDTNGATGILRAGGVQWMRAGKGAWHAGDPGHTRGFQLWVALSRTTNPARLAGNLDVFDFALTAAEMAAIHDLARADSRIVDPCGLAPTWAPIPSIGRPTASARGHSETTQPDQ